MRVILIALAASLAIGVTWTTADAKKGGVGGGTAIGGASSFAPGRVKPEGSSARDYAPGQVKLKGEPAKNYAPGQRMRQVPVR